MYGKAVTIRYCPATVSDEADASNATACKAGRRWYRVASQETGPAANLKPNPRFRGEEDLCSSPRLAVPVYCHYGCSY